MKQTKYIYTKVIQQVYVAGYGWEDVSEYECNSQGKATDPLGFKYDLGEYKFMSYPTRTVTRKTLRP